MLADTRFYTGEGTRAHPPVHYGKTHAPAMAARGYAAIQITPSEKTPGTWDGSSWRHTPGWNKAGVPDGVTLKAFASGPPCSVGVVLGPQGDAEQTFLVALDIDVLAPAVAAEIMALAQAQFGAAPVRFGRRPKCLLLLRCADPIGKHTSGGFRLTGDAANASAHRVELLAAGQQFVAFGRHPCGVDYEWHGASPADTAPSDLPLVTRAQVLDFLAECDRIMLAAGGVLRSAPVCLGTPSASDGGAGLAGNVGLYAGTLALIEAIGRDLGKRGDKRDIRCPFSDEHPNRADEGAALLPGGGVRCLHSTCEGRRSSDFREQLELLAHGAGLDGQAIFRQAAARAEFSAPPIPTIPAGEDSFYFDTKMAPLRPPAPR